MPSEEPQRRQESLQTAAVNSLNGDAYGTSWFLKYHDADLLNSENAQNAQRRKLSLTGLTPLNRSRLCSGDDESMRLLTLTDTIFDLFKNSNGRVPVCDFLQALTTVGIRRQDPRLRETTQKLKRFQRDQGMNFDVTDALQLTAAQFTEIIKSNIVFIYRVLKNHLVIREWPTFCKEIEKLYEKCRAMPPEGSLATYIPQLARADPTHWGVSVCTVDGQRFSLGDAGVRFCLEAASFPLNYAIVLDDLGAEVVHNYVGQEPSGHDYNALVLDSNNKPHNPMINAGAMVICSLFKKDLKIADRFDYIFKYYEKFAGGEYVGFSNQTYLSERSTADRNFALAHFMRESKCFVEGVKLADVLDLYFQTCSVEINCESGAVIAATLANGGCCPITGDRAIDRRCIRDVLSLMYSCGMNNYSGQFAFRVGLAAKSGVSGCVLLVIPDVMGICLYSPLIDQNGVQSVKGVQFANELVASCNFHTFDKIRSIESQSKYDPRRPEIETKAQQIVVLLFAASNGDVTAMRRLLLQGLDLGLADYEGRTAMHIAAGEGHLNCIRFLITKAKVPHLPKDRWGRTPIDDAMHHGHSDIVNLILEWDRKIHAVPLEDVFEDRRDSLVDSEEYRRDSLIDTINSDGD